MSIHDPLGPQPDPGEPTPLPGGPPEPVTPLIPDPDTGPDPEPVERSGLG